jgi:hypothetical protein
MDFIIFPVVCWPRDFTGSIEFTYNTTATKKEDKLEREWTSTEVYNLYYNRTVSEALAYQILMRASRHRVQETGTAVDLAPQFFINVNNIYFQENLSYTREQEKDQEDTKLTTTSLFSTFIPKLSLKLPQITLYNSLRRSYDNLSPRDIDSKEDTLRVVADYLPHFFSGLSVNYSFDRNKRQDNLSDAEQITSRHDARTSFVRTFWNRLSISGGVGLEHTDTSFSQPQPLVFLPIPARSFWEINSNPFISGQPQQIPELTDGDLTTPSQIDLGLENNNMILELGKDHNIATIHIYLIPRFSGLQGPSVWEVYESTEGLNWTLARTSWEVRFNTFQHRYEISFRQTLTTQYIKVVNRNRSQSPYALVTELQAVKSQAFQGRVSKTRYERRDWNAATSLQITPSLAITSSTYFQEIENQPSNTKDRDRSLNLELSFNPNKYLFLSLGRNKNRSEDLSPEEKHSSDNTSYYCTLSTEPLETLRSSMSFNLSRGKENAKLVSKTFSSSWYLSANPYPGIEMGMNLGWTKSVDIEGDSRSTTTSLLWELNLRPRDWIIWGNSYNLSWNRVRSIKAEEGSSEEVPGKVGIRQPETTSTLVQNLRSDISFTPSSVWNLRTEYEYTRSSGSATSFIYLQTSFLPSEKLQFSANYTFHRSGGQKRSDASLSGFWRLNMATDISLNYGYQRTSGGISEQSQTFSILFITRF